MASKQELTEYLTDHLAYERDMLAFTFSEIQKPHPQEHWNALIESFGVHARNLYDFLRSDSGSRNVHANDYVANHKVSALLSFNALDTYFFHTAKQRLKNEKFGREQAAAAAQWIDREWERWATALPEAFSGLTSPARRCDLAFVQVETSVPSATNHITTASSDPTTITR
jgi:hypothetical protein